MYEVKHLSSGARHASLFSGEIFYLLLLSHPSSQTSFSFFFGEKVVLFILEFRLSCAYNFSSLSPTKLPKLISGIQISDNPTTFSLHPAALIANPPLRK